MSFDEIIDRRGTHCAKWDKMEAIYGVPAATGLAMWVADMDFRPPKCVLDAVQAQADHGFFGYFGDDSAYLEAIRWWMDTRHGWQLDPAHVFTTHGLVNGTAMCVDTFTQPGDAVVLFTPVYHAFARVIKAADRRVVECEMVQRDSRYEMDF
ncbi:MAG: aminotransferase class I/II-fold pyridoxal phosphate-dependent enzyme, partial [Pseudomonadota bacterium]